MYGKLIETDYDKSNYPEDGHYTFEFENAMIEICYYSDGALNNVALEDQYYFDIIDVNLDNYDFIQTENLIKQYI